MAAKVNLEFEVEKALCISYKCSPIVERQWVPFVEVNESLPWNQIHVFESSDVLIEKSSNSSRISFKIRKNDEIDELLCHKFMLFLMRRAEIFQVVRRKPIMGYDISFVITANHLEKYILSQLAKFITQSFKDFNKEISDMKIYVNNRARGVASTFLDQFKQ